MGESEAVESTLWADVRPDASRRLTMAALEAMAEHGYHGTTTREIADRAGMSPAALYVHYPSKGELLYQIAHVGHESLLEAVSSAARSGETPTESVRGFTHTYVTWHARYHRTARVIQYELRSLPRARFREIVALRTRFDMLVRSLLEEGAAAGEFAVDDVDGTALAILSLGVDVARWYSERNPRSPEQVADLYAVLVLRMLAARE